MLRASCSWNACWKPSPPRFWSSFKDCVEPWHTRRTQPRRTTIPIGFQKKSCIISLILDLAKHSLGEWREYYTRYGRTEIETLGRFVNGLAVEFEERNRGSNRIVVRAACAWHG